MPGGFRTFKNPENSRISLLIFNFIRRITLFLKTVAITGIFLVCPIAWVSMIGFAKWRDLKLILRPTTFFWFMPTIKNFENELHCGCEAAAVLFYWLDGMRFLSAQCLNSDQLETTRQLQSFVNDEKDVEQDNTASETSCLHGTRLLLSRAYP